MEFPDSKTVFCELRQDGVRVTTVFVSHKMWRRKKLYGEKARGRGRGREREREGRMEGSERGSGMARKERRREERGLI